jgi:hypothetical protein
MLARIASKLFAGYPASIEEIPVPMTISLVAVLLLLAADEPRPPAPNPMCLDARTVDSVRQLNPQDLLVSAANGRFRLSLAPGCAELSNGAELLAEHGWVCGNAREYVQAGAQMCAVTGLQSLSMREFSQLARDNDKQQLAGATTLPAVESVGERAAPRRFTGSHDYCVRPSMVRAWSVDPDGVVVRTNAEQSGGNRAYRIEFAQSCPQADYLSTLSLKSGIGLDLVCGNPGDVAMLSKDEYQPTNDERMLHMSSIADRRGCMISAVYPIE